MRHAESRTNYPNALRVGILGIVVMLAIHWNACVYYQLSAWIGLGSDDWVYTPAPGSAMADHYFFCVYWSTMLLLTIGEMDHPVTELECVFMTIDYLLGILIIASVVGGISETIAKTSVERDSFRHRLDNVKNYMSIRHVDDRLERRVITWFDYLCLSGESTVDEQGTLGQLPESIRAEIAMNVHANTLRRVAIFRECETGLLTQLL